MTNFAEKTRIDDARGVYASDKALLVDLGCDCQRWIPQSQIDDDSEVWRPGDEGTLVINAWWANKEGLG